LTISDPLASGHPSPTSDEAGQSSSCGYEDRVFGATYPDGRCIDGWLWDLDSADGDGFLTSGGDIACPRCNTAMRLDQLREEIQQICDPDTPQDAVWNHQVFLIVEINPGTALEALAAMPRHAFWRYRRAGTDIVPARRTIWPWRIPGLSAHQNLILMRASRNPAGTDPEAADV